MPYHQPDAIRYFTFGQLEGLTHAIFSRHGGVSSKPWAELNVGGTVGDDPQNVRENRRRIFNILGLNYDHFYDVWQVHGNNIVITKNPRLPLNEYEKADAILTNVPDLTLFMRFADCVPILLWDPTKKVIGIVHAGWKGTVSNVTGKTIESMKSIFKCHPEDIRACIGPSIASHHYPVSEDVADQVRKSFGMNALMLLDQQSKNNGNEYNLDLWLANKLLLEEQGIIQVEVSGICTVCDNHDWYSHRGEKGKTGRFGALISL